MTPCGVLGHEVYKHGMNGLKLRCVQVLDDPQALVTEVDWQRVAVKKLKILLAAVLVRLKKCLNSRSRNWRSTLLKMSNGGARNADQTPGLVERKLSCVSHVANNDCLLRDLFLMNRFHDAATFLGSIC